MPKMVPRVLKNSQIFFDYAQKYGIIKMREPFWPTKWSKKWPKWSKNGQNGPKWSIYEKF